MIPGGPSLSPERLGDAVAGLAGILGFLLVPTLGAWLRLLLRFLETEGLGLGRRRSFGGLLLLRALALSAVMAFFTVNWQRAIHELHELRVEAPIIAPSLAGLAVGAFAWLLYALGLRLLRADLRRARTQRRLGGLLR
ncbi:MAG: hypothetical protein R3B09_03505 [Nannocystaceae bacterium]